MNLIFIRHAEPDYTIDSLTEKGFREAKLLAERTKDWKVDEVYLSPLGRAQDTASFSLANWDLTPTTYEWLQEFYYRVEDPVTGQPRIAWDFYPEYFTKQDDLHDKNRWAETKVMKSGDLGGHYKEVTDGLDELLSRHGYKALGNGLFEVEKRREYRLFLPPGGIVCNDRILDSDCTACTVAGIFCSAYRCYDPFFRGKSSGKGSIQNAKFRGYQAFDSQRGTDFTFRILC